MNIYAIIILAALIIDYVLEIASDLLNLSKLGDELPSEFSGVYSPEAYKKSQEYTRVRTKFGFITSTFGLAVILIFWFAVGFEWLDSLVRGWIDNEILRGIVYIGLLMIGNSILSLPFSIYSTFVIEERFGFNKTTPKTFIMDILKSGLLSLVLGVPVLAAILAILQYTGTYAWLYGWGTMILFSLIIQFIAPTWIMPLFNKFKPLEEGELRESILNYARKVNFSLKNVFVMDGSKRSSKSNAFFTGFGRNKRIALFDTLIAKHTTGELVAVLAHEIGHYKKRHIIKGMILSILHFGVLFYLLQLFLHTTGLYEAFYISRPSVYTGLLFFGMLYSPVELILGIIMNIFSRKNEYEADKFAVQTIDMPEDMVNALKKLSEHNLSNLTPHPFYVFVNYSHPPVLERIRAIREETNYQPEKSMAE